MFDYELTQKINELIDKYELETVFTDPDIIDEETPILDETQGWLAE
ncbi:MAG: hypothetical protein R3250_00165 [Melioribacteraceae bacterium]|nr:hypothetical protein [Melioribacteraceae bacterium]